MNFEKYIPTIIRAVAIIAIIAFFVPYCCVSCYGHIEEISAAELTFGFDALEEAELEDFEGFEDEDYHVDGHPVVALLIISPIVVIAASFFFKSKLAKMCANLVCALVTLIANLGIGSAFKNHCIEYDFESKMEIGYTLNIIYSVVLIAVVMYFTYTEFVVKNNNPTDKIVSGNKPPQDSVDSYDSKINKENNNDG